MVAQLTPDVYTLPLLMEPARPAPGMGGGGWSASGWRLLPMDVYERNHAHDVRGALAQHIIARYYLGCVSRDQLAREYGYGVRQVQAYLSGRAGLTYTQPLLATLRSLGISTARRGMPHPKLRALVLAQNALIAEAADLLRPHLTAVTAERAERRERFLVLARLMAFVDEQAS